MAVFFFDNTLVNLKGKKKPKKKKTQKNQKQKQNPLKKNNKVFISKVYFKDKKKNNLFILMHLLLFGFLFLQS